MPGCLLGPKYILYRNVDPLEGLSELCGRVLPTFVLSCARGKASAIS